MYDVAYNIKIKCSECNILREFSPAVLGAWANATPDPHTKKQILERIAFLKKNQLN